MEVECLALKDLTSPKKKSFTLREDEDGGLSDQKENIYAERRRSTPLKSSDSPAPTFLLIRKGAIPDLDHITPIKHTVLPEPWTPTANLKMLISAASPDIRDREMKKVLFRPIENEREKAPSPEAVEDAEVEESCQFEAAEEEDDADKKPSRKQKSLGLLCQKFLALYPDYPPANSPIWISLDEVANSLGVERRRIYDIVNVLESLMIVGRMAKNSYTWYGRQRLEATLEDLQRRGRQQGYHLQMEQAAEARGGAPMYEDDGGEGDAGNGGNRKDKSLRIMSQKFVMLFLVSKTQTVTLDTAAKVLIEESQDSSSHSKYKTKVRRLYDIANVLTSLNLIKKVHVRDDRGRKPAFKWLGPVEFNNSGNAAVSLPGMTQPVSKEDIRSIKMSRHASFNITPASVAVQRLVSSAPSSPRRETAGLSNQPVDYSIKTTNNAAHRLKFDNSTEIRPSSAHQTSACSSPLPQSSSHPTLLAPSLHPEHLFTNSPSPHCLAYLPSLSQPSVVMLYRAPDQPETQRSPGSESEEGRKRKREGEEEVMVGKRKGSPVLEECDKRELDAEPADGSTRTSPESSARTLNEETANESTGNSSNEPPQPSHYLYVPNNAGLNTFNFLLSAGQTPAGFALPPSSVPALPVPYILVPSAAIPHYPLVAGGLQQQGPDAHNKLSFSLPAVMSPAHFMVPGGAPFGIAAATEVGRSTAASPSTPEQSRVYGSSVGGPHSPAGPRQGVSINTPEPLTPHTPKESTPSASKAFFQTPGTLGNVVSAVPAARKRGSAQRRLDVGHPPPTC